MKTSRAKVVDFLKKHHLAFIATVSKDRRPHGATIYYTVDEQLVFYFATKNQTRKYKNIQSNPNISLVVVDNKALKIVQVDGIAHEIVNTNELTRAIVRIAEVHHNNNLNWSSPITKIKKGHYRFIKVVPKWLRFIDFSKWENKVKYEEYNMHIESPQSPTVL